MRDDLGVIVSYCSLEKQFIDVLLGECAKFTKHVILSCGKRLYDGAPEDENHLGSLLDRHPSVGLVRYPVPQAASPRSLHNAARFTGAYVLPACVQWVFVIDGDEVPEGDRVRRWLEGRELRECKLANYWYLADVRRRATTWEDSIVLCKKERLADVDRVFTEAERDGLLDGNAQRRVVMDGRPMWHHYSWVRSGEGLSRKVQTWGHRDDFPDAEAVVRAVQLGVDCVHGYAYETLDKPAFEF